MISAEYCRLMARYNNWQNTALVQAADSLTTAERWQDRGAFFRSIAATFNHLYWADALILERIKGNERPQDTLTHSLAEPSDWARFKAARVQRDHEISHWAEGLQDTDLTGAVAWVPLDGSARVEMSRARCVAQLFNHQTHHRGQIHAMLTSAGATTDPTDLSALPE